MLGIKVRDTHTHVLGSVPLRSTLAGMGSFSMHQRFLFYFADTWTIICASFIIDNILEMVLNIATSVCSWIIESI